jgi:hypothetical protein
LRWKTSTRCFHFGPWGLCAYTESEIREHASSCGLIHGTERMAEPLRRWRELAISAQRKPAKMPFYVSPKDGVPLTFAGLWERWGPDNLLTCTILTTDASDGIRGLHTCMPVMLAKDGL